MTIPDAGAQQLCPACRRAVPAGGRFCPSCGSAQAGSAPAAPAGIVRFLPWIIAAGATFALVLVLLKPGSVAPAAVPAAPASQPGTAPPDLSTMSPAERFDRLYRRIITAAQSGDQATVTQFTPMAIAAFGMLDTVTVDARYHLAMLQLHVGALAEAQSQADSIKRENPEHLFSYVIGAAVARWNKNDTARDAAYREFLKRYDAQVATRRPEYLEHQAMLEEVKRMATAGKTPS